MFASSVCVWLRLAPVLNMLLLHAVFVVYADLVQGVLYVSKNVHMNRPAYALICIISSILKSITRFFMLFAVSWKGNDI